MDPALIEVRIHEVREHIADAANRAGRNPEDVLLIAVSKTYGMDAIDAACEAGVRNFGENRVEEAAIKIPISNGKLPADITWHMIGHIQSRKTSEVSALFQWVHSADRVKIARRLSDAAGEVGQVLEVLLEVNVSGEESKSGFDLSKWPNDPKHYSDLMNEIETMLAFPGIRVQGLMTMAPYSADPESARPLFRRLRELRDALREQFPQVAWTHLSMGMTADYEVAVEEGATMVRVGTAIFGPRS